MSDEQAFRKVMNTAHYVNLDVRYDGHDLKFEGDWIKHRLRERDELREALEWIADEIEGSFDAVTLATDETFLGAIRDKARALLGEGEA